VSSNTNEYGMTSFDVYIHSPSPMQSTDEEALNLKRKSNERKDQLQRQYSAGTACVEALYTLTEEVCPVIDKLSNSEKMPLEDLEATLAIINDHILVEESRLGRFDGVSDLVEQWKECIGKLVKSVKTTSRRIREICKELAHLTRKVSEGFADSNFMFDINSFEPSLSKIRDEAQTLEGTFDSILVVPDSVDVDRAAVVSRFSAWFCELIQVFRTLHFFCFCPLNAAFYNSS